MKSKNNNNLNSHKMRNEITKKLGGIPVEELSFSTGFEKHTGNKITGALFVESFFKMIQQGNNTVEDWAGKLYEISGDKVSSQSIQDKLQFPHITFSESLLFQAIHQQELGGQRLKSHSSLLDGFKNVLLEDSTTISLPDMLLEHFKGSINQHGSRTVARLQVRMNLKKATYTKINLGAYTDNDQKYSPDIVQEVEKGDLVIRDLGYWSIDVFKQIAYGKQAYFLSRYKFGNNIYETKENKQIDLLKKLRKLRRRGGNILDMEVRIGKEHLMPVRLVAIKCPPQVEQQRKRKANKDKRTKRSAEYMEFLGWTIYITNVSKDIWKAEQVHQVYGFRWRIEMIFKCWKSNFKFAHLFKGKHSMSLPRVRITVNLLLTWLVLFFVNFYNFFLFYIYKISSKILSTFKFMKYLKCNLDKIINIDAIDEVCEYLVKYCVQTKRKSAPPSQLEIIYMLNYT